MPNCNRFFESISAHKSIHQYLLITILNMQYTVDMAVCTFLLYAESRGPRLYASQARPVASISLSDATIENIFGFEVLHH
jgi:hypothetical protein